MQKGQLPLLLFISLSVLALLTGSCNLSPCLVVQCLTLCDPVDCSPPGSSVHGTLQAGILEWVAISSSRRSFQTRDRTQISCRQSVYNGATWEAHSYTITCVCVQMHVYTHPVHSHPANPPSEGTCDCPQDPGGQCSTCRSNRELLLRPQSSSS